MGVGGGFYFTFPGLHEKRLCCFQMPVIVVIIFIVVEVVVIVSIVAIDNIKSLTLDLLSKQISIYPPLPAPHDFNLIPIPGLNLWCHQLSGFPPPPPPQVRRLPHLSTQVANQVLVRLR